MFHCHKLSYLDCKVNIKRVTDGFVYQGHSSTATTPHSDVSDRSSNQSPGNIPVNAQAVNTNKEYNSQLPSVSPNTVQTANTPVQQPNADSQVPVVSWKNPAEERELYIRDGRRAFYPALPPPSQRAPPVMMFPPPAFQSSYPNQMFSAPKQNQVSENYFGQRQHVRGHSRPIPFIPKFPDSFNNNNNPLAMNNNFHDKKIGDMTNGIPHNKYLNNRLRGGSNRGYHNGSPPPSKINPSISNHPDTFPSPQIVQQQSQNHHYERQYGSAGTIPGGRGTSHQQIMSRRLPFNKRQNGQSQNTVSYHFYPLSTVIEKSINMFSIPNEKILLRIQAYIIHIFCLFCNIYIWTYEDLLIQLV